MNAKKILICDDDQGILDVLEMTLELEGFMVNTEINSTNLLKVIENIKPDLLLMDLWMPVLSGDQLLNIIRLSDNIKNLPVIIFSASVDGNQIATAAGADGFISKPFDLDHLITKVQDVLASK
ncbi:response regulator [Chryseobacterium caseinilyticum]|uniref:Response regulator n=1 Tax=Chryseobacterium caseinilyticum TaxID=2771428 RepID=A0ABR8Z8R9_9FLAO|nr:response regulator [Chryseobacterium caseinilyticum]MBD8081630.1 response regulator [Chryseobacterium caseinilyticum]